MSTDTTSTDTSTDTAVGSPADAAKTADVMEHLRGVRDALTVRRVFGDPYELDGVTVIPVARVAGGGGGGGGESNDADDPGSGFGSGFGIQARGIGVYEVHDGTVAWKPAVDVTRLAKGGQALAGIALVCLTLAWIARPR